MCLPSKRERKKGLAPPRAVAVEERTDEISKIDTMGCGHSTASKTRKFKNRHDRVQKHSLPRRKSEIDVTGVFPHRAKSKTQKST
jgi:hypothetical protein